MRAVLTTVTMIAALTCVGMASDGVIEINQARALAGGVTPSDTPGFPVTIDTPGSYRLTSDLDVAANLNASVVSASHVSIDLNGFVIGEAKSPGGLGITTTNSPSDDISVANGTIQGFGSGVYLGGIGVRVERIRITDASLLGIYVGPGGLVSGCTIRNADLAIQVVSGLVTGNVVTNSNYGLSLGGTAGYSANVLIHNTFNNVSGGVSLGANLCDSKLCQ
jgi:hypothetical protein